MFEIVEKLHRALGIESTWLFVLIIALGFGCVTAAGAGGVAWIVDRSYKRSLEHKADQPDPKPQTVTAVNPASQGVTVHQTTGAQSRAATEPAAAQSRKPISKPVRQAAPRNAKVVTPEIAPPTPGMLMCRDGTLVAQGGDCRMNGGANFNCVGCSITDSYISGGGAGIKVGAGPVLIENGWIEGGITCARRAHPIEGMPNDCQDVTITNSRIGGSAVFENSGKAERVFLGGNIVRPSITSQTADIVKNNPGGDMKDVTALNNEIGASPPPSSQPSTSSAFGTAPGGGVNGALIEGNQFCDNSPLFNNGGSGTNLVIRGNTSISCPGTTPLGWREFLEVFGQHRNDIQWLLSNWTAMQELTWKGRTDSQLQRDRDELNAIEAQLLAASDNADRFTALLKDLESKPPHFDLPRKH